MASKLSLAAILAMPALSLGSPLPQVPAGIVGGTEAQLGDFPYIVSIARNGGRWCGGSLLDANTILTAAHCSQLNPSSVQVRAGSLKWSTGGKQVGVSSIVSHPDYNAGTVDNDVAIWRLASPIEASDTIGYATLAKNGSDPVADSLLTVAGWGALTQGGPSSEALQKVTVPVVSRAECREQYGEAAITEGMFCAGLDEGGKDSCQGDSGGPIVDDATGEVVGVVSWGQGCAQPGFAGVYARVGQFISFITSTASTALANHRSRV
ncbi:trypsin-like cysteine/serine peptidase domain-containing protein [Ilyonectria robusta]|uniref:trypsin-like cysteine/serine peptidase domain-containing protein n=1 Tax=Ilyonectria robusta TaxID=1079257 RepID=UPI001E8DA0DD|nr:trypsin-like cysteine/serine peptidase domain-containing protein [Ilyonectria robusta]KAH8721615.1 trypsin-like cysteine/serine peptidase domain-containing protein [Ilyonectria robusta]